MKKKVYSFAVMAMVAGIAILSGCNKDSTPNGKVKSKTESFTNAQGQTSSLTTTYTYDGQGRITLSQPSSGNVTSYSYGNGSITVTSGTTVITGTLNGQNLLTSTNTGFTFTYDNNGYLIASTAGASKSTVNTITDGNVTSSTTNDNGNSTTTVYSYSTKSDYRDYGQSFFGKNSKNLVTTETISNANGTLVFTHTYTFDEQGRVQTETTTGNNTTDVLTFVY